MSANDNKAFIFGRIMLYKCDKHSLSLSAKIKLSLLKHSKLHSERFREVAFSSVKKKEFKRAYWNNNHLSTDEIIHSLHPKVRLLRSLLLCFMNYGWKIVSKFAAVFNKSHEFRLNIRCDLPLKFPSRSATGLC